MHGAGKRARAQAPEPAAPAEEEPDVAAPKAGRRRAADYDPPYSQEFSSILENPFGDRQAFLKHEKDWASSLVKDKALNIRHNFLPCKTGYKISMWCNSCENCQSKNGWKGYSEYRTDTKQLSRKYTPLTCLGDFSATRTWNPLTSTAEHALKQFVAQNAHFTTQDLVKIVEKHQQSRPSDDWLQTWGRNHKVHKGTPSQRCSGMKWVEADWKQLERDLGLVDGLEGAPNALKIASASYEPNATVVCFCNPALLKETVERLANKEYIKLCGDGTFRLTNGDWILLTVGTLTKHYSCSDGVFAFRTTFNPLMFALTNKESEGTYQCFLDSVVSCCNQFAGVDLVHACRQYHADLHAGEDLAQKAVFQQADRVAGWAHVIGACTRSKMKPATTDRIAAYRAGALSTMKKHLSAPGQKLVPLIERTMFCMRSLPTALLFHSVASLMLDTLEAQVPSEKKAADMFQQYYLVKMSPADAHSQFGIDLPPEASPFVLSADWWAGLQRLQPGSASGTQAQESWHRHKLKAYLGLRSNLDSFGASLGKFTQSRLADLLTSETMLPDVPGEPFPDRALLYDSDVLTKQGRTSAHQFFRTKAFDVYEHAGTVYVAMRKSLCTWDATTSKWTMTPDEAVPSVPPGLASGLARLTSARKTSHVVAELNALGLGEDPFSDVEQLVRFLANHVLVIVGPEAAQFWRSESVPENLLHTQAVCGFCQEFCLHASCEHTHTAFLHLGSVSLRSAEFGDRARKTPLFEQEPVQILRPGSERGSNAVSSHQPPKPSLPLRANKTVSNFLLSCNLEIFEAIVQKQCVSVDLIAALPLADLIAALPGIPSGVLCTMQTNAKKWLASGAAASDECSRAMRRCVFHINRPPAASFLTEAEKQLSCGHGGGFLLQGLVMS
eukprot:Skav217175  [mRNA]  locus=scaffold5232:11304:13991:+ [translate_table: standard]